MKTKVTIQEIADFTGVSKFAVSRALSGKSGVSPQTRDMILKAGQLGYFKDQPNQAAGKPAAFKIRKTENGRGRCLFYSRMSVIKIGNPLLGPVFDGISARLNQKGLDILTLTEPSNDHMFTLLNPRAFSGL